jgi:hypothetical protein
VGIAVGILLGFLMGIKDSMLIVPQSRGSNCMRVPPLMRLVVVVM